MIDRTTVRPPSPESNTPIGRRSLIGVPRPLDGKVPLLSWSPPQRSLDLLLGNLQVGRPRSRGQVLPAPVGEQADDLRPVEIAGHSQRRVEHRAGGDAREDA